MDRIAPWLALIIAAGVVVASLLKIDQRNVGNEAIPTPIAASPGIALTPSAAPTEAPTSEPTEAPAQVTQSAPAPSAPSPSKVSTPAPTPVEPTPTVAPPETPSPEPALTAGPIDTSRGPTPHTGGGAGWGVLIAIGALLARAIVVRPRSNDRVT